MDPTPFFSASYSDSYNDYGRITRFEEERQIMVDDLNAIIELINKPRVDLESIVTEIQDISQQINTRLLNKGLQQGHAGDNSVPVCFRGRCIGLSHQLKEYSVELTHSPNLAQPISYALQGIVYLIGTLTICECTDCDNYSIEMERSLIEYSRQVPYRTYFMPSSLEGVLRQIEVNFKVMSWTPSGCTCWCLRCSSRGIAL
ncbi:uncharacterized protein N7469_006925 [Penicillium citrinum]|uniref:Uncharacterized protein n=2 Tax=Penicillium TaxID=5073 RepID=A0A9W9NVJ0_PENCI|nr:uncharacterized protein N7469_006925 [Penicillium citrinum]KAJ5226919.1 hypothetical protein N7469_006925 [Penicillium citrinum]KAJ5568624.1 hypothetical protein N7450_011110 [Penicillium hetheringtonii]KAK5791200.1 hypothetical protein VI817_006509 [Penicillium citrinum]